MNRQVRTLLLAAALLITLLWLSGLAGAGPWIDSPQQGGAPNVVSYQGRVTVNGSPYSGTGYFKFAVVNGAGTTTYWSNDGTSTGGGAPTAGTPLPVSGGLFNVLLGDTSLSHMTQPLDASVFEETDRTLRVWFSADGSTYELLTPDQRIAAVPYALQAEQVQSYAGVVVVAKSGGDYTRVGDAVASIDDASGDNPYLIWVAPGVYEEQVTLKPHVHLLGAGEETTIISSTVSTSDDPPNQATVVLADESSLRDLSVEDHGNGDHNVAVLLAGESAMATVSNVTIVAWSSGGGNAYGVYAGGHWTRITLLNVTATAAGSGNNYGLYNDSDAILRGGHFAGRYGSKAYGIYHVGSELEAGEVHLSARNAGSNYGLYSSGWRVWLRGGTVDTKGGGDTWGIHNTDECILEASDVDVYSEGRLLVSAPSQHVLGLVNDDGATAILMGGLFKAYGGSEWTRGLLNDGAGSTLEAHGVIAQGAASSSYNFVYGLLNQDDASAVLRGGSYTGKGGKDARGILNAHDATLDAQTVAVKGMDASGTNYGLYNQYSATAQAGSSTFIGTPAARVTGGTVRLAVSQLDGGATTSGSGALTCFGAYNGSYLSYTCP